MPRLAFVAGTLLLLAESVLAAELPKDLNTRLKSFATLCAQDQPAACDQMHSALSALREGYCVATVIDPICQAPWEELDCPKERLSFKIAYQSRLQPLEQQCLRGDPKSCHVVANYLAPFAAACRAKVCCQQEFASATLAMIKQAACKAGAKEDCVRADRSPASSSKDLADSAGSGDLSASPQPYDSREKASVACKLGNRFACDKVTSFDTEAKLRSLCQGGNPANCMELVNYLTLRQAESEAHAVLFQACGQNHLPACQRLNVNYPLALRKQIQAKTDASQYAKPKAYEVTLDTGKKLNLTGRLAIENWDPRHPKRVFFTDEPQNSLVMLDLRNGKRFSGLAPSVVVSDDGSLVASYTAKDWGFCGPPDIDPEFTPEVKLPPKTHVKVFEIFYCQDKQEPWCRVLWTQLGIGEGVTKIAWDQGSKLKLTVVKHSCVSERATRAEQFTCDCADVKNGCRCQLE